MFLQEFLSGIFNYETESCNNRKQILLAKQQRKVLRSFEEF